MRRTKAEADKTRSAILNAAATLFSEKGFEHTTLQDIAVSIGATRGAIYWHFKNKTEIFDAIHERLYQPLMDLILEDVENDHPDPLGQLQEICANLLIEIGHNQQKRQALHLFLVRCDFSGELAPYKEKNAAKKAQSRKLFQRFFQGAMEKGHLRTDRDTETLALAISCFMKGIIMEYLNEPGAFDISTQAPRLIATFFEGLKK